MYDKLDTLRKSLNFVWYNATQRKPNTIQITRYKVIEYHKYCSNPRDVLDIIDDTDNIDTIAAVEYDIASTGLV
ncbi:hypothetical protein DSECCO2_491800 [anaerobic digester metagenome]